MSLNPSMTCKYLGPFSTKDIDIFKTEKKGGHKILKKMLGKLTASRCRIAPELRKHGFPKKFRDEAIGGHKVEGISPASVMVFPVLLVP